MPLFIRVQVMDEGTGSGKTFLIEVLNDPAEDLISAPEQASSLVFDEKNGSIAYDYPEMDTHLRKRRQIRKSKRSRRTGWTYS